MRHGQLSRDGRIWVGRVLRACSLWERMRGLLGVGALGPDAALLIERCGSVHTVGMRFPIDVVFLSREWRIVRIVRAVRPGRLMVSGGWRAVRTLESEAGLLDFSRVRAGDALAYVEQGGEA
jgi:uncharacterized membrane protein (UPF0127 family)